MIGVGVRRVVLARGELEKLEWLGGQKGQMRWHREDWSAWLIQFEWRYLLERRMDLANDEANDRLHAHARGWTDDDITLWLSWGGEILDLVFPPSSAARPRIASIASSGIVDVSEP